MSGNDPHSTTDSTPSASDWLEFTLLLPPDDVEMAADVLRHHCAGGVSIEEPIVSADREETYAIDRARPVTVRAYLPRTNDVDRRRRALRRELRALGLASTIQTRWRREEEWADAWKQFFDVQRIGDRLVVCPTWIDHEPQAGEVLIRLDPGMAFGTGQHPTTRMCLEALESHLRPGQEVLDVGTGSGILAIASALLGASRIRALDINPVAVEVARQNAIVSGVEGRIDVLEGSLGPGGVLAETSESRFDIVVANIDSFSISDLAPYLARALVPGGTLVVSGITEHLAGACRISLENVGLRSLETVSRDGWCALICTTA